MIANFLHFVLIIQPILLSVQSFTYRGIFSQSHKILGFYMMLISIYFFVNASFLPLPAEVSEFTQILIAPLFVSLNPFYYLYVRSLTQNGFNFNYKSLYHFIPGIIFLIIALLGYFFSFTQNDIMFHYTGFRLIYYAIFIYFTQFFIYIILMVRMLLKHKSNLPDYFSYTENITLNWLWIFMLIYIVFNILDASLYFFGLFSSCREFYYVLMIFFINFFGYFGLKQADVYLAKLKNSLDSIPLQVEQSQNDESLLEIVNNEIFDKESEKEIEIEKEIDEKYISSNLSEKQKELILNQLEALMENKKLYTNHNLTINDVALKLKTNYKYVSQVINEKLNKNFYSFVNEYRISAAIEIMKSPVGSKLSIEGIAKTVGFHSRSAFNNAFKKFTGHSPSSYIKLNNL